MVGEAEIVQSTNDLLESIVGINPYVQIREIDDALSLIEQKKLSIPLTYQDNDFDVTVRLSGNIRIINELQGTDQLRVKIGINTEFAEFVIGQKYKIAAVGASDWTTVGWVANQDGHGTVPVINDVFVANAKGTFGDGTSEGKAVDPPGLYILNTATGTETQAFSGSNNPWTKETGVNILTGASISQTAVGSALQTNSAVSQATNLILKPTSVATDPKLLITTTDDTRVHAAGTTSESISEIDYTHKIGVIVNGEQYFLLSQKGATVGQKTEYKVLLGT